MISETTFAQSFSSTWRLLAPATDLFVRKLNAHLYEREFPPLLSMVDADRRGFINEAAFQLFKMELSRSDYPNVPESGLVFAAADMARQTIARIERIRASSIADPRAEEVADLRAQTDRLRQFFFRVSNGCVLKISPEFPGCGIIDSCRGDVCFDGTLYEIKAGDRNFRSVDIRQLLVYAALSKSAGLPSLRRLGLFNPRTGISFCTELDLLCLEVSGTPSGELLSEIVRIISSADTSR